jgi:AcrR family transcriptional regulator
MYGKNNYPGSVLAGQYCLFQKESYAMRSLDEEKRLKILSVAAELFATQPFHKVLLSDVAEAASVGKGTLYLYFKDKEDLYASVLYNGFTKMLDHLREQLKKESRNPTEKINVVIRETVEFAYQNPYQFEVMRTVPGREAVNRIDRSIWDSKRWEFKNLVATIIRDGISQGIFEDPNPDLTARYIPGLVRSALFDGVENVDKGMLTSHIIRLVGSAIIKKEAKS